MGVSLAPDERDHLTPLEVLMLQHPQLMEKNLELLERDSQRLQNLLDWRDHEDTYWKWMVCTPRGHLLEVDSMVLVNILPDCPLFTLVTK